MRSSSLQRHGSHYHLKSAKALGLTIPRSVLVRADQVMGRAIAKIPSGRSITMATTDQPLGHLSQSHPEIWKLHLVGLLMKLAKSQAKL